MEERNGYNVFALDHHGHGNSAGERAQTTHFSDFVSDVLENMSLEMKLHENFHSVPLFLLWVVSCCRPDQQDVGCEFSRNGSLRAAAEAGSESSQTASRRNGKDSLQTLSQNGAG